MVYDKGFEERSNQAHTRICKNIKRTVRCEIPRHKANRRSLQGIKRIPIPLILETFLETNKILGNIYGYNNSFNNYR